MIRAILAIAVVVMLGVGTCAGVQALNRVGTTPVDQCINLDDTQLVVPTGYVRTADGVCKPVTGSGGSTSGGSTTGGSTSGSGTAPVATVVPGKVGTPPAAPASASGKIGVADLKALGSVDCYLQEDGKLAGARIRANGDVQIAPWADEFQLNTKSVKVVPGGMYFSAWILRSERGPIPSGVDTWC